jgi:hypothetical protein
VFDGQARRGDVDADARADAGQPDDRQASSISVVWASSIEKARTSARGRSLGSRAPPAPESRRPWELLVQEALVMQGRPT